MTNLSVNYLGIPMKTPLIGASGTVGFGLEIAEYVDMNKVGAISGKGLAPTPWPACPCDAPELHQREQHYAGDLRLPESAPEER